MKLADLVSLLARVATSSEETTETLTNIEAYCPNHSCGESVSTIVGSAYHPRRMNLQSVHPLGIEATYWCPVCGNTRMFKTTAGGGFSQQ